MREIDLQHPDGSHKQWITRSEAERMRSAGQADRVSRFKFRLAEVAQPSLSRNSAPMLKRHDLNALVGFTKCDEIELERLKGHGLLPIGAWVTQSGRIRVPQPV